VSGRLGDRVAIVTGAGQGLGAGYAKEFAGEGAAVVLAGRTTARLEKVAGEIAAGGGRTLVVACDVGVEADVKRLVEAAMAEFGHVDILVNNAAYHVSLPIEDVPLEEWARQLSINLTGTFLCCRAVIPAMKARRYGKIINISSSAATTYFPGFGAYAASKAGIVSLTRTLSEELKEYGINVNVINLGMTNTEHTRERMGNDAAVTIPLEEMLQVDEVAKVALFLASDESSPIMGAAIEVLGRKA
jgi:NAD(P)-dependent dehydrogenase (short-subunit alcohol dehydrogenase family)